MKLTRRRVTTVETHSVTITAPAGPIGGDTRPDGYIDGEFAICLPKPSTDQTNNSSGKPRFGDQLRRIIRLLRNRK